MKHATSAAVALALGLGLAVTAAQAHGYQRQSLAPSRSHVAMNRTGAQSMQMQRTAMRGKRARGGQQTNQQEVKQAQQALQQDNLYQGKIDGRMGPKTKQAIAQFQQQNGLPKTARLDQNTLNQLTGGQAAGVGSSTPNNNNNLGQSNSINQGPMTPPATQNPNAGDNNTNNPNTQR